MNLTNRMEEFNKRWSITSSDSHEVSFNKFKTRVLNIFEDIDDHVTKESVAKFCQVFGVREVWNTGYSDHSWSTNIHDKLNNENDEKELFRSIEVIFSLHIRESSNYSREITYSRDILFRKMAAAIELSNINVAITATTQGEVILYPKGIKLLDNVLVDTPLIFLNKASAEHFIQALQFYQDKEPVKSAESLRRTLEEFLRYKLGTTKGLNANIAELQKKLKIDGRDSQVRNIITSAFNYLDKYFNENSKHNDGDIDELENEFLIYQVGLLCRYTDKSI